jgi:putative acyl-CoA dehydrogenase
VICLDLLRTFAREPEAMPRLAAELEGARGLIASFDDELDRTLGIWGELPGEAEARWCVERLAVLFAAAVMLRAEAGPVAEAYVMTRVGGAGGRTMGAWPRSIDRDGILSRVLHAEGV